MQIKEQWWRYHCDNKVRLGRWGKYWILDWIWIGRFRPWWVIRRQRSRSCRWWVLAVRLGCQFDIGFFGNWMIQSFRQFISIHCMWSHHTSWYCCYCKSWSGRFCCSLLLCSIVTRIVLKWLTGSTLVVNIILMRIIKSIHY